MVKIPTFSGTKRTVASTSQFTADPRIASQGAKATAEGLGQALNIELSMFAETRRKAQRAELTAKEAKHNLLLSNFIPKTLSVAGAAISNTMNVVSAIDEQDKIKEERVRAKNYVENKKIRLTEDLIKTEKDLRNKPTEDGKGYSQHVVDWMNARIQEDIKSAPNEEAQSEYLKYTGDLKVRTLENALIQEKDMRRGTRLANIAETTSSMNRIATDTPEAVPSLLDSIGTYEDLMRIDGFTDEEIAQQKDNMINSLRKGQIQGLLGAGDPEGALNAVLSEEFFDVSTSTFIDTLEKSVLGLEDKRKEILSQTDIKQTLEKSRGNLLVKDADKKKAADMQFENLVDNLAGSEPVQQQFNMIAHFSRSGDVIGTKTKAFFEAKVRSSDSEEAVVHSNVIMALADNPSTSHLIADLDSRTVKEALKISRLSRGMSPTDAVELVRKERINVNPALKDVAKDELKALYKENDAYIQDLVEDSLSIGFFSSVDDVGAAIAAGQEFFETAYLQDRDEETARLQTGVFLRNQFKVTNMNGDRELMSFAPESIYNEDEMEEFQQFKELAFNEVKASAGIDEDLKIRPIPGLTNMQGRDVTSYLITDKQDNPILGQDGNFLTFEFDVRETETERLRVAEVERLEAERKALTDNMAKMDDKAQKIMIQRIKERDMSGSDKRRLYRIWKNRNKGL